MTDETPAALPPATRKRRICLLPAQIQRLHLLRIQGMQLSSQIREMTREVDLIAKDIDAEMIEIFKAGGTEPNVERARALLKLPWQMVIEHDDVYLEAEEPVSDGHEKA